MAVYRAKPNAIEAIFGRRRAVIGDRKSVV